MASDARSEFIREDYFGRAIAVSGDRLLIGARRDDGTRDDTGAAYIFDYTDGAWVQTAKLVASDPQRDLLFGTAVALDGGYAIVGAIGHASGVGAAYLFEYAEGEWVERQKLTASDASPDDAFGTSVQIAGDRVVIGAPFAGPFGTGQAYVFERGDGGWSESSRLSPLRPGHRFGSSLSLDEDRLLVGAMRSDASGVFAGAAYVFEVIGGAWTEGETLVASDAVQFDEFGYSVALMGDVAFVGAPEADNESTSEGTVYVYEFADGSWAETHRLTASDAGPGDDFGRSIALDGDRAVVGADGYNGALDIGAAYVFERSGGTWAEIQRLTAQDAETDDGLGFAVGLSGDRVFAGATNVEVSGYDDAGAVYAFESDGTTWAQTQKLVQDGFDHFGDEIAVEGNRMLIAAVEANARSIAYAGVVYVYEFIDGAWTATATLTAPDASPYDYFGSSVSLSGDRALVGAQGTDAAGSRSGSAYVFLFDGADWALEARLTADDAAVGDQFGIAVGLDGDQAAIGSLDREASGRASGAVYVFERTSEGWDQRTKLTSASGSQLGIALSLEGDRLAAGANRGDNPSGVDTGHVVLFEGSGAEWVPVATLAPSDGDRGDNFGASVSLSGSRVAVGAFSHGQASSGAAYLFEERDGAWSEVQKLVSADVSTFDLYGSSVSVSGDRILVGSREGDGAQAASGYAALFEWDGLVWTETEKLEAPDGATRDYFGQAVVLVGERAVIGAPLSDSEAGPSVGSVYVYSVPLPVASGEGPSGEAAGWRVGEAAPNPTRGLAQLALTLPEPGEVLVRVFDALGRLVGEHRQSAGAGTHRLAVPVGGLAPGAYVVRVEAPGGVASRRLTVVR